MSVKIKFHSVDIILLLSTGVEILTLGPQIWYMFALGSRYHAWNIPNKYTEETKQNGRVEGIYRKVGVFWMDEGFKQ